jgi:hypothetical protein
MLSAALLSPAVVAIAESGTRPQLLAIVLAAHFRRPLTIIGGIFDRDDGQPRGSILGRSDIVRPLARSLDDPGARRFVLDNRRLDAGYGQIR